MRKDRVKNAQSFNRNLLRREIHRALFIQGPRNVLLTLSEAALFLGVSGESLRLKKNEGVFPKAKYQKNGYDAWPKEVVHQYALDQGLELPPAKEKAVSESESAQRKT